MSAAPFDSSTGSAVVSIKHMRLSDGRTDYFVSIKVGDRDVTPHVFREEYKAAYHVALYDWLLNDNGVEPCPVDFGPDDWPARILDAAQGSPDRGNLARKFCKELCGQEVCTDEGNWLCPQSPEGVNEWCLDLADIAIADLTPAHPTQGGDKGEAVADRLVDWVYLHATEGQQWPSTKTKSMLIARAMQGAPTQDHADGMIAAAPQPASNAYASPIPRADADETKNGWRLDFKWLDNMSRQIEKKTGFSVTQECVEEAVLRTEALLIPSTTLGSAAK